MKRGAPDHWKMDELAKALKIPRRYAKPAANGIMERLWHYTAKMHPQGDIGASPDWAIAEACGWLIGDRFRRNSTAIHNASVFISSLISSNWIDIDKDHRLIVHDWHEHADDATRRLLKNNGLTFLLPEKSVSRAHFSLALPNHSHSLPPPAVGVEELDAGWESHRKHIRGEPKQLVYQQILDMGARFDRTKFLQRHPPYCRYWAAHGWQFCGLSFWGWIEADMPDPPPETESANGHHRPLEPEHWPGQHTGSPNPGLVGDDWKLNTP